MTKVSHIHLPDLLISPLNNSQLIILRECTLTCRTRPRSLDRPLLQYFCLIISLCVSLSLLQPIHLTVLKLVHVVSPISCCKEKQLHNCVFHIYILRAPYKIFLSEINRSAPLNFLFVVQQPNAGLGRLITEVSSPAILL